MLAFAALPASQYSTPAFADDLAVSTNPVWSGPYAGFHATYLTGELDTRINGQGSSYATGTDGGGVGVQVGYNHVLMNNWLVGLEADVTPMGYFFGSSSIDPNQLLASVIVDHDETRIDAQGTLRGRLGYVYDDLLFYGTGGLAWASIDQTLNVIQGPAAGTQLSADTVIGGWTAGAGLEYAFTPSISLRTEYLYSDLGAFRIWGSSDPDTDPQFTSHAVRVGMNFALAAEAHPAQPLGDSRISSFPWSLMVFGGVGTGSETMRKTLFRPWDLDTGQLDDHGMVGVAASRQLVRFWDYFWLETELGAGYRFEPSRDYSSPEGWAAIYLKYDGFPWNDYLRTSVGISTGLSLVAEMPPAETDFGAKDVPDEAILQHYLSPEIAFSLPEHPENELVLRLHHRSSSYYHFWDVITGSNVIAVGLRMRR